MLLQLALNSKDSLLFSRSEKNSLEFFAKKLLKKFSQPKKMKIKIRAK